MLGTEAVSCRTFGLVYCCEVMFRVVVLIDAAAMTSAAFDGNPAAELSVETICVDCPAWTVAPPAGDVMVITGAGVAVGVGDGVGLGVGDGEGVGVAFAATVT